MARASAPLPWLWEARARGAGERGTVVLLWSSAPAPPAAWIRAAPLRPASRRPAPAAAAGLALSSLRQGRHSPPLRALPCYRLLHDLPRLLRAGRSGFY